VGPDSDPLLLRKCGSAGNQPRTSESAGRNYDHYTTEGVQSDLVTVGSMLLLAIRKVPFHIWTQRPTAHIAVEW
jgi:hypothetical protein